jgi:hypothetical protein
LGAKNKTGMNTRNSCAEIIGILKNTEFQEYETGILKQ